MTAIETKSRKPAVIENELASLNLLILKRNIWLNKHENRLKGTYKAVLKDTNKMQEELAELRAELTETTSHD